MSLPEPPDEAPSLELLRRLRDGDGSAFEVLYRRHRDESLLAVRTGMGPRLRATMQNEDVLQSVVAETLVVLREEPPQLEFTGLLRRLIRYRLIDRARKLSRRGPSPLPWTPELEAPAAVPPSYHDPRYQRLEEALQACRRNCARWFGCDVSRD